MARTAGTARVAPRSVTAGLCRAARGRPEAAFCLALVAAERCPAGPCRTGRPTAGTARAGCQARVVPGRAGRPTGVRRAAGWPGWTGARSAASRRRPTRRRRRPGGASCTGLFVPAARWATRAAEAGPRGLVRAVRAAAAPGAASGGSLTLGAQTGPGWPGRAAARHRRTGWPGLAVACPGQPHRAAEAVPAVTWQEQTRRAARRSLAATRAPYPARAGPEEARRAAARRWAECQVARPGRARRAAGSSAWPGRAGW